MTPFAQMHNDYLDPDRYFGADEVVDIETALRAAGAVDVVGYWDQDGNLHAGTKYEDGRLPHVGHLDWDDDKSEDENAAAAAAIIAGMFKHDSARSLGLSARLNAYRRHKRAHPAKVPTFAAWCKGMDFPRGSFEWDDSEAGDPHVYNCGESDCPVGWHQSYYTQTIVRKDGKVYIEIHSGDEDGNWDFSDGYEQGEPVRAWEEFYRTWLADTDDYFIGWVEYHLDCAQTHSDPCGVVMGAENACSSKFHLDAAADMLKYLKEPS